MRLGDLFKTWRTSAGKVVGELYGGLLLNGGTGGILTTLTYGPATIIPDMSLGDHFVVSITDNVAFVVGAPINTPPTGFDQLLWITFRNTSGGAHGAGTWNAIYKTQATVFPAIATGFSRTVVFRWNGTNWVEQFRSAADIAN